MELQERISEIEASLRMTGMAQKSVLTFDEAAKFTGLSKSYLYKLTSTQKVPHYKPMGKLCYFDRVELEAWIKSNRVSTIDEISEKAQSFCMKGGKK
jgi:excisionase family DNA binding protein